jgi:hypothetical protein
MSWVCRLSLLVDLSIRSWSCLLSVYWQGRWVRPDIGDFVIGLVVGPLVGPDVGELVLGPVVGPNIGGVVLGPLVGLTVAPNVGEAVVGILVELLGVDVVGVGPSATVFILDHQFLSRSGGLVNAFQPRTMEVTNEGPYNHDMGLGGQSPKNFRANSTMYRLSIPP